MSPDLEIIMMAASILEKSGFRLICLWCYCLFLVTLQSLYSNLQYKVCDVVLRQWCYLKMTDLRGCV